MKKLNKHIEIVRSSKKSLSSMGQKSSDMIQGVLSQYYTHVSTTIVNDISDLEALVLRQPDLVFLGMKNIPLNTDPAKSSSAKIWLSTYLDMNDINYTGSPGKAIALDFDKPTAKQVVIDAGLKTSDYFTAHRGQYNLTSVLPLDYPLFVKPPNTGGGKGIGADSVARDFTGFRQKVQSIKDTFGSDALVESYLPGREFSVAILETINSRELVVMPIELITEENEKGDRILGKNIKSDDTEQVIGVKNGNIKNAVMGLATDAFRALGARDYGRIDIRLDQSGIPHFLEANLVPGLSYHDFTSYFTSACQINQAMDYESMILYITRLCLARNNDYAKNILKIAASNSTVLLAQA